MSCLPWCLVTFVQDEVEELPSVNLLQNTSANTRFYRVLMGKYFKAVLKIET